LQKNRLVSLVVIYVLISATFSFIPALAQSPGQSDIVQSILDESKSQFDQKRAQLVQDGITIPPTADALYDDGLIEYNAALTSLDSENPDEARDHALEAMSLFEDATELLYEAEQDFQSEQDALLNEIFELGETIANSESDADELQYLASENNLNVSFTDYDNAIATALGFLAEGDLDGARQQYEIAQNLLADIYDQIHDEASSNVDQRAQDFVANTITQLDQIIANANEFGISQSIIDQLQDIIDDLQNVESTDDIIDAFDESSDLNDLTTANPEWVEKIELEGTATVTDGTITLETDDGPVTILTNVNTEFDGFVDLSEIDGLEVEVEALSTDGGLLATEIEYEGEETEIEVVVG